MRGTVARSIWWTDWPFSRVNEKLSILDVVSSGAIDYKLAGLLWLLMEHRASVLVAAGPVWAGKTTVLHALLDFLPPGIRQVPLRGYAEDFKFSNNYKPDNTYLVSEEISNHQYEYLWGYQVVKAFELLAKGFALGGTIHARNVREVAYVLHGILNVPLPLIARLGAIITLQVTRGRSYYEEPVRRVDTVSIINQTEKGLIAEILAARESTDNEFMYPAEKTLHKALSNKFGIKYDQVFPEITLREKLLSQLHNKGTASREEVKKAIADFYRSRLT
jgi:hypothetical protein